MRDSSRSNVPRREASLRTQRAYAPGVCHEVGDVIERLDGVPVAELVGRWEPYYPASNRPTRLRDIARAITQGPCGAVGTVARRAGEEVRITARRQPLASLDLRAGLTHHLPGEAFRLLSEEVAYLKLSSVQVAQVSSYVERAKGTRGLVIDIRNYPSEFVVFALGSLLVERPTPFARFTIGDLEHPGAFRWSDPVVLSPQQPHYAGKVVILVDEISLSQAEYTAMAFRSSPRAVVVGSTTAGADGNVSPIPLPGGLSSMISGIGVFYPDKRPTQRIGIVADVEAHPTIAGIRAGRDEVLEKALRQILGPDAPADRIENLARPRPLIRHRAIGHRPSGTCCRLIVRPSAVRAVVLYGGDAAIRTPDILVGNELRAPEGAAQESNRRSGRDAPTSDYSPKVGKGISTGASVDGNPLRRYPLRNARLSHYVRTWRSRSWQNRVVIMLTPKSFGEGHDPVQFVAIVSADAEWRAVVELFSDSAVDQTPYGEFFYQNSSRGEQAVRASEGDHS